MADLTTITQEGAFDGTVRTQINANFTALNSGDSGGSILHQATVTRTDTQIKGLPTQANWPTLVAAPGENKVLILSSAVVYTSLESGYIGYSTDYPTSIITISYDDDFQIASSPLDPQTVFHDVGGRIGQMAPGISTAGGTYFGMFTDIGNVANLPLKLVVYNTDGNLTGGDPLNTMSFSVSYLILNTTTGLFE